MPATTMEPLAATLLFAAIFLFGGKLHTVRPRRAALSLGAGVSTAYVFVHMLPEMSEAGNVFVEATAGMALPAPELRIYVSALAGFIVFYGLEHLVARSREQTASEREGERSGTVVYLHIGGFAAYAALVSYLMVRGISETPVPIALYAVAMGLHFLGVDHSLLREHREAYNRIGRFLLAGAVLAGWGVAMLTEISKPVVITGLGLVSGGVVMNSMIMELPGEKDGRFWPFVAGAVFYTGLLALVR